MRPHWGCFWAPRAPLSVVDAGMSAGRRNRGRTLRSPFLAGGPLPMCAWRTLWTWREALRGWTLEGPIAARIVELASIPSGLSAFMEAPTVLAIQLLRFKPEGARWVKSHVPVRCPPRLSFPPSRRPGVAGALPCFALQAVILHEGDIDTGHFKAVTCWHGRWWLCDDARVTPNEGGAPTGASADVYGAFYAKVG